MPTGARTVTRFGQQVPADEVFEAWTSGNIPRMLRAVALPTNVLDRHYLLLTLVEALYRLRAGRAARKEMLRIGGMHLAEMPVLIDGLLRDARAVAMSTSDDIGLPSIPTFLLMVRVLCEDGRHDDALRVWRHARAVGYLDDGGLEKELAGVERRRQRSQKQCLAAAPGVNV